MKRSVRLNDEKLPYPTRPLEVQGGTIEEYIIPDDKKSEVLERMYLYRPIPSLDDEFEDIHEGKRFRVRDFRVTRGGDITSWSAHTTLQAAAPSLIGGLSMRRMNSGIQWSRGAGTIWGCGVRPGSCPN